MTKFLSLFAEHDKISSQTGTGMWQVMMVMNDGAFPSIAFLDITFINLFTIL